MELPFFFFLCASRLVSFHSVFAAPRTSWSQNGSISVITILSMMVTHCCAVMIYEVWITKGLSFWQVTTYLPFGVISVILCNNQTVLTSLDHRKAIRFDWVFIFVRLSSCQQDRKPVRAKLKHAAADDDLTGTRLTEIGMSLDTDGCPQQKEYDYLLKFLLVGDSDVGKQEMLNDLEDGSSESPYCSGSGNDVHPFLTMVS